MILQQRRARSDGVGCHGTVELGSPHHISMLWVGGMLGPRHRHLAIDAGDADAAVTVLAGEQIVETHVGELADRPWRERIAARLVARERPLLDDGDAVAVGGQPVRGRGAGGTSADDEHLRLR